MTCSMTAFALQEQQAPWGQATWELRSVNHRYLDLSFHLPEPLSYLEPLLRKAIRSQLQRGRIEVKLRYQPPTEQPLALAINESLARSILQAHTQLARLVNSTTALNPSELLHWPQLLTLPRLTDEYLQTHLLSLFRQALQQLIDVRQREGSDIKKVIKQRLNHIQTLIDDINQALPTLLAQQRTRLCSRLSDLKLECEPHRLEQEIVLLAQKNDISEEVDRLQIHLNEFNQLLNQDRVYGKKLDFLLQELNRETNTLAAKSLHVKLSLIAVELKMSIEEIREQVQNIE